MVAKEFLGVSISSVCPVCNAHLHYCSCDEKDVSDYEFNELLKRCEE